MSIYINLNDEETAALEELAREERRTPNQQAAYMIVSAINQQKYMARMNEKMAKGLHGFPYGCTTEDIHGDGAPIHAYAAEMDEEAK